MRKKWDGKNWGRYRILGTYFQLGALDITQYALRIREWYFCEKLIETTKVGITCKSRYPLWH